MAFIDRTDLKIAIRDYEIEQIVSGDDTLIDIMIDSAIAEIIPYLHKYDTDLIFSQEGASRNSLIVRYAVDITIYLLCTIATPNQDIENRRALYDRAIGWLREVRDESMPANLPRRPITPTTEAEVIGGSRPPRDNSKF